MWRFFRRIPLLPGVRLNLSRSGLSLSLGPRGAQFTIGPGGPRLTLGIPGTGLYYSTPLGGRRSSRRSSRAVPSAPSGPLLQPPSLEGVGVTPAEEAFLEGVRLMLEGDEVGALTRLENAAMLADAAYLAGFLALKTGRYQEAVRHLYSASVHHADLGRLCAKFGISAGIELPLAPHIHAHIEPNIRGVILGLTEAYQRLDQNEQALETLETLQRHAPGDPVVLLSRVELLLDSRPYDPRTVEQVLQLTAGVTNDTYVHSGLLFYRARALRIAGQYEAARILATDLLRIRAGRPADLLDAIRLERALACEALGQKALAQKDVRMLLARMTATGVTPDPELLNLARRLGLD